MKTIGFIGAGNMAEAIIKGIISGGLYDAEDVFISDVRVERLTQMRETYHVVPVDTNAQLAQQVQVIVLSVKPKNMRDVLEGIRAHIQSDTLIISIIAGKRIVDIAAIIGDVPIIRVMPNTPALIGEGASALFANESARSRQEQIRQIFLSVGQSLVLESEDQMDAVTAVSGSGPAYYFLMIDHMIQAGMALGLPEAVAKTLALQTAKGAALLAEQADQKGESPTDLAKKVATPGGTTEAACNVFHALGFKGMVLQALKRAAERSQELSRG